MRRAGLLLVVATALLSALLSAGTLAQSRWNSDLSTCSRATDADGSTVQEGKASMRWIPPLIHCRFEGAAGYFEGAAREIPSAEVDHVSFFGVAIAIIVSFALVLAYAIVAFLQRRRSDTGQWESVR